MLIARFRPHPCADIMQGLFNDDDEWCYWLERLAEMNDRLRHIAIEEEYARYCEHRAKRRRIEAHTDPLTMLRLESFAGDILIHRYPRLVIPPLGGYVPNRLV